MFGSAKKEKTLSTKVDTIVGKQTQIEGDIRFSGGLHVDGRIRGNVIAEEETGSVLTISEHGSIEGDVQVPNVILNGSVHGNVRSGERIELAAKARVTGDVYYKLIEMAMGAEVNGNLVHQDETSSSVVNFERDQQVTSSGSENT